MKEQRKKGDRHGSIRGVKSINVLILSLLFTSISGLPIAQLNLLHKKTNEQLERKDDGPNTKNWWSSYLQFGFMVPLPNHDSLGLKENLSSTLFEVGYRYKHKLGETFSTGIDFGYNFSKFNIKQSRESNLLSPGFENKRQSIRIHALSAGVYVRINFGKRGNIIGKYLDLSGNVQYTLRDDMLVRNSAEPGVGVASEKIKNVYIQLPFVRDFHYFGTVRFGWNFVSLFAKYRLSEIFTADESINENRVLPNLPPFQVGVEISQGF